MSKKNICKVCGKEKLEKGKEICSTNCFSIWIESKEFQKELDDLIDSLDKPKTKK